MDRDVSGNATTYQRRDRATEVNESAVTGTLEARAPYAPAQEDETKAELRDLIPTLQRPSRDPTTTGS